MSVKAEHVIFDFYNAAIFFQKTTGIIQSANSIRKAKIIPIALLCLISHLKLSSAFSSCLIVNIFLKFAINWSVHLQNIFSINLNSWIRTSFFLVHEQHLMHNVFVVFKISGTAYSTKRTLFYSMLCLLPVSIKITIQGVNARKTTIDVNCLHSEEITKTHLVNFKCLL